MATGTIKWYNSTKGYGFIKPDAGNTDIFVHATALEPLGVRELKDGQKVGYELESKGGKTSAVKLQLLD